MSNAKRTLSIILSLAALFMLCNTQSAFAVKDSKSNSSEYGKSQNVKSPEKNRIRKKFFGNKGKSGEDYASSESTAGVAFSHSSENIKADDAEKFKNLTKKEKEELYKEAPENKK